MDIEQKIKEEMSKWREELASEAEANRKSILEAEEEVEIARSKLYIAESAAFQIHDEEAKKTFEEYNVQHLKNNFEKKQNDLEQLKKNKRIRNNHLSLLIKQIDNQ